jgi:hypothetical protein
MTTASQALLQSFIEGPLLVADLPEAATFPFNELSLPDHDSSLNPDQKLGHLCEDAIATLLDASTTFELLVRNLQVQADIHTTVGELDFLIRDLKSGQLIHLELATKFYLAVETNESLKLPGPDARDNYFEKLKHLRKHQLTLTRQFQDALPESYQHQSIIPKQLIYGCLFDNISSSEPATAEFINPHCRRGQWLTIKECPNHFPKDTHFQIIPKHLWPVPLDLIQGIELETWIPSEHLDRCVMLRVNDETVPYFITPADYPS